MLGQVSKLEIQFYYRILGSSWNLPPIGTCSVTNVNMFKARPTFVRGESTHNSSFI